MFNTDDFFKENPIEPETVFEHTEPVISIDDLIGTPVHGLFIKSKINSAFDWGTRSVLWKRELNKEITRLRKAAFSDEAPRVIQIQKIQSKIQEIHSYEPCVVVDDERRQWEDEQRDKLAKADEAKTTCFWEQYKERQAKGQTADDDDCNPPIPQSIKNDSAGSQGDTKQASAKVVISVGVTEDDSKSDERASQLHLLIWRVHQFLSETKKPTAQKLWNEIQFRHESHDTGGIIQEVNGQQILWCSGYGNEQRQLRSTFDKTLSILRKSPPF